LELKHPHTPDLDLFISDDFKTNSTIRLSLDNNQVPRYKHSITGNVIVNKEEIENYKDKKVIRIIYPMGYSPNRALHYLDELFGIKLSLIGFIVHEGMTYAELRFYCPTPLIPLVEELMKITLEESQVLWEK